MPVHSQLGIPIAVEGIDGSGKTTQVSLLAQALEHAGLSVVTSKEPTDGYWGQRIRRSATEGRMPLSEELDAFIADREEHVQTLIQPSLQAGSIVILDRYFYSTVAYQGARGANPEEIRMRMDQLFPIPDAVFLLDVDPRLSILRIEDGRGEEPNDFEQLEGLSAARRIFNSLGNSVILTINGSASIETVHSELLNRFVEGPLKRRRCSKDYGCDDPFNCGFRLSNSCEWWKLSRLVHPAVREANSSIAK